MILDDILARTRADLTCASAPGHGTELVAAAVARTAGAVSPPRCAGRARSPHLRVQAALAVSGLDQRDGRLEARCAPTRRAARRAVGADRRAVLRRAARRPEAGAARVEDCRCCAKTSSSTRIRSPRRRAAGADAILLIVAALDDATIAELLATARATRLDVLVEAHDAGEVARAVAAGAEIIGMNNRDLRTFTVDRDWRSGCARRSRRTGLSWRSRGSGTTPTSPGCATPGSTRSWSVRR